MAKLIVTIINKSKKLKLISLKKNPSLSLFDNVNQGENTSTQNTHADNLVEIEIYRHPMELVFNGNYANTLEFIKRCIESNITLDGYNLSQLGHDFWLTRNGHGTGFWDRKEIYRGNADDLSKIASTFGTVNLFIDSSGKIDGE